MDFLHITSPVTRLDIWLHVIVHAAAQHLPAPFRLFLLNNSFLLSLFGVQRYVPLPEGASLSASLCVCLRVCLPARQSVFLSARQSVFLSARLFFCPSVCLQCRMETSQVKNKIPIYGGFSHKLVSKKTFKGYFLLLIKIFVLYFFLIYFLQNGTKISWMEWAATQTTERRQL